MHYMGVRVLRARKQHLRQLIQRKMKKKIEIYKSFASIGALRASPCSARQSILLIKEILFHYWIDSVAQNVEKIKPVEKKKIENCRTN